MRLLLVLVLLVPLWAAVDHSMNTYLTNENIFRFFLFGVTREQDCMSKIVVTFAYIIIMFFYFFQFYCYSGQRTGVVRDWSARRFPIQFKEIMFRCINFRKHSTKFLRFLFSSS